MSMNSGWLWPDELWLHSCLLKSFYFTNFDGYVGIVTVSLVAGLLLSLCHVGAGVYLMTKLIFMQSRFETS
jgi:hypothetical protein